MYDTLETDLSFEYLCKISKIKNAIIVGGWAVYFYVNENYRRAFGIDYLKSRDIDVFIKSKFLPSFLQDIKKLGFIPSSYFFRYELVYSRDRGKIVDKKTSKQLPIHNLVYVFLDMFTDKQSKKAWGIEILNKSKVVKFDDMNIVDINTLLELKCYSFFERDKLDKELKDACDIYSILIYSGKKLRMIRDAKEAIEKIIKRRDLGEFIAENVLRDITKVNIVNDSLRKLL